MAQLCLLLVPRNAAVLLVLFMAGAGSVPARALDAPPAGAASDGTRRVDVPSMPLLFQPNRGQADAGATFVGTGPGLRLSISGADATLDFGQKAGQLRVRMMGANRNARAAGERQSRTRLNYYTGTRPVTDVPTYERVRIADAYPGIDVVYYGNQDRLEYDFVVAAGADPSAIRFALDGADAVMLADGALRIALGARTVDLAAPVAFQEREGVRQPVEARYRVQHGEVTIVLEAFDRSRTLVIDPQFWYATFVGGSGADSVLRVAMGPDGSAYLIGITDSPSFPPAVPTLIGTSGPAPGSHVAFLAKLNQAGSQVEYLSYWGNHDGRPTDVTVDANHRVFVAGRAFNPSASLPAGFASAPAAGSEGYLMRFDETGALVYGTYVGGAAGDEAYGVATDGSGMVWVAGFTNSDGPAPGQPWSPGLFPIRGATYQPTHPSGRAEGFVVKIDTNATGDASLVAGTFVGGDPVHAVQAVEIDVAGNVYIAGTTVGEGSGFGVVNGFRTARQGRDAFVAKLDPGLQSMLYSTYVGGSGDENDDSNEGYTLAVNDKGHAWIAGSTTSSDFLTTPGAMKSALSTVPGVFARDGFIVRVDTTKRGMDSLVYATLFGGEGFEYVFGLDVDVWGQAYVVGTVVGLPGVSPFPISPCTLQASPSWYLYDSFLLRVNPAGTGQLSFSTYIAAENAFGVAVDNNGFALIGGRTNAAFPTTPGAFQQVSPGDWDGFAAMVHTGCPGVSNLSVSYTGPATAVSGEPITYTATVTNAGPDPAWDITLVQYWPYDFDGISVSDPACVVDPLPSTTVTCLLSLEVGESRAIAFTMTPHSSGPWSSGVNADVDWPGNDPDWGNNGASATVTVTNPVADLSVTYTGPAGPVLTGTAVTYTAMVTNAGPQMAPQVVVVLSPPTNAATWSSPSKGCLPDPWPQQAITCQLGALPSGQSRAVFFTFTPTGVGTVTSGAQVGLTGSNAVDSDISNDSAMASLVLREPAADIAITYTGPAGPLVTGQPLTYTGTVTNNGPDAAPVVVYQYLPNPSTAFTPSNLACLLASPTLSVCDFGVLDPGEIRTLTFTFTPLGVGTVNTGMHWALVPQALPDPNPSNDSAWISLTLTPPGTDLSIGAAASTLSPMPNVPFSITLTVQNSGALTATNVLATAKLTGLKFVKNQASGCISKNAGNVTCPSFALAPGASKSIAIQVVSILPGPYLTTYAVSAVEPDPAPANNASSITVVTPPLADLAISTAVSSGPAKVGQPITYTMTVANAGPSAATSVTATLAFNNGIFGPGMLSFISATSGCVLEAPQRRVVCTAPALASGASQTFSVTVTSAEAMNLGTIASVTAAQADLTPSNNARSLVLIILP